MGGTCLRHTSPLLYLLREKGCKLARELITISRNQRYFLRRILSYYYYYYYSYTSLEKINCVPLERSK